MAIKRPKHEETVVKLRQVEVLMGKLCLGLTQSDRSAWLNKPFTAGRRSTAECTARQSYAQHDPERVTEQREELKRLQKENERLRRAVSDLTLNKLILLGAASGPADPRSETSEPLASAGLH